MWTLALGTLTRLAVLISGIILMVVKSARWWFRPLNGETCIRWRALFLMDSWLQVQGVLIRKAVDPTFVLLVQEALTIPVPKLPCL